MLPHAFRTNISQCTFKSDRDFEFVKLLVCQISICSNDCGYTLCCSEMLSCICQPMCSSIAKWSSELYFKHGIAVRTIQSFFFFAHIFKSAIKI